MDLNLPPIASTIPRERARAALPADVVYPLKLKRERGYEPLTREECGRIRDALNGLEAYEREFFPA